MVTSGTVEATDGSTITIEADTLCLHGDTPGAAELAKQVRAGLESSGVSVRSLTAS
jgi:UPF0271 protein